MGQSPGANEDFVDGIADLAKRIRQSERSLQRSLWAAWVDLPFDANGVWGNNGGSDPPLQYRRNDIGGWQVRGHVRVLPTKSFVPNGTGAKIATIPATFAYRQLLPLRFFDAGGIGATVALIEIGTTGAITFVQDLTGRTLVAGQNSDLPLPLTTLSES